jgi:hypothetical protein
MYLEKPLFQLFARLTTHGRFHAAAAEIGDLGRDAAPLAR